ncbi:hypothetical protein RI054_22g97160 [Pseudoscourfieldia marina]
MLSTCTRAGAGGFQQTASRHEHHAGPESASSPRLDAPRAEPHRSRIAPRAVSDRFGGGGADRADAALCCSVWPITRVPDDNVAVPERAHEAQRWKHHLASLHLDGTVACAASLDEPATASTLRFSSVRGARCGGGGGGGGPKFVDQ